MKMFWTGKITLWMAWGYSDPLTLVWLKKQLKGVMLYAIIKWLCRMSHSSVDSQLNQFYSCIGFNYFIERSNSNMSNSSKYYLNEISWLVRTELNRYLIKQVLLLYQVVRLQFFLLRHLHYYSPQKPTMVLFTLTTTYLFYLSYKNSEFGF